MLRRLRFLAAVALAGVVCGCSKTADDFSDRETFVSHLLPYCLRDESSFNPKPMELLELEGLTGPPDATEAVDRDTRKWRFDFANGPLELYVVLEPGSAWDAEEAKVFVDVQRSGILR